MKMFFALILLGLVLCAIAIMLSGFSVKTSNVIIIIISLIMGLAIAGLFIHSENSDYVAQKFCEEQNKEVKIYFIFLLTGEIEPFCKEKENTAQIDGYTCGKDSCIITGGN